MYFIQLMSLFFFAAVKFLFAPALGLTMGFGFLETAITSALGGMFGFLVFFFAGQVVFGWLERLLHKWNKVTPKTFSKRNRWIVRTKQRFGLGGMAFLSAFISMPISGLIVAKYYKHRRDVFPIMLSAIVGWSALISVLLYWVKPMLSS